MLVLSARLKFVIETETEAYGRYALLAARSNIPAATWRTWWNRGGTPSGSLLEAVAKLWPQYAFWLATGCTDDRCGHIPPPAACQMPSGMRSEYSQAYFKGLQRAPRSEAEARNAQSVAALASLTAISSCRAVEVAHNFEIPDSE